GISAAAQPRLCPGCGAGPLQRGAAQRPGRRHLYGAKPGRSERCAPVRDPVWPAARPVIGGDHRSATDHTTELAANSVQHADAPCRLAFWQRDGNLVCQARDTGQLDDPLAGRLPSPPDAAGGRGLFLVNAIADLVRTHTSRDGTTIQAYL